MLPGGVLQTTRDQRQRQPALFGRCFVSAVFGLSAFGKLLDPLSLVDSLRALGWSNPRLASAGAAVLLCLEVAVAYGLWPARHRLAAGRLALGLSACFLLVTAYRLAIGSPDDCGCFGLLIHLTPPATLLLDVVLLVAALTVARADGGVPAADCLPDRAWFRRHRMAVSAGALILLPLTGLYAYAWRLGHAPEDDEPLPRVVLCGQPAPALSLIDADGHTRTEADLLGEWHLVVFADERCKPCRWLSDDIAATVAEWRDAVELWVVVKTGGRREVTARAWSPVASQLLADPAGRSARRWLGEEPRYPTGFLVAPDGIVRHHVDGYQAITAESLGQSLAAWARRKPLASSPGPTSILADRPVPRVRVRTLDGVVIDLPASTHRRSIQLSFVSNSCGSCTDHTRTAAMIAERMPSAPVVLLLDSPAEAEVLSARMRTAYPDAPLHFAGADGDLRMRFGVTGVPTTMVVRDGVVLFATTPSSVEAELVATLEREEGVGPPRHGDEGRSAITGRSGRHE